MKDAEALHSMIQAIKGQPCSDEEYILNFFSKTLEVRVVDGVKLGRWLRDWREECGLSLREAGRRMKWSAPYVGDLELGRRKWTLKTLTRYIAAIPGDRKRPEMMIRTTSKATLPASTHPEGNG